MKRIFISMILLALSATTTGVFAQNESGKKKDKEIEEIIIRNDGNGDYNKMDVQIIGDSVLVNGKPLAQFKDDKITINKRKMIIRDGERSMAFDFGPGDRTFNMDSFGDDFMKNFGQGQGFGKEEIKPFLGVTTEQTTKGVKIVEISKGSAAEKAGLKKDDIITKIGDQEVGTPQELANIISESQPKEEIKIYYTRGGGKEKSVKATLGERKVKKSFNYSFSSPEGMGRSFSIPPIPPIPNQSEMELFQNDGDNGPGNFKDIMPRQKKIGLKVQDTEEGGNVKVIDVEEGSAAATAGIKKDDLITEIDGVKINSTDDAREQLQPGENKTSYKVKLSRNGTSMNFDVKIPKKLKTANL